MRISDWSSDVCSSDLLADFRPGLGPDERAVLAELADGSIGEALRLADAGGLELYREMVRMLGTLGRLDVAGAHALGEKVGRKDREEEYATLATLLERWLARLVVQAASKQRSEEHTSELQSLMRISYAVFCLKKNIN